MNFAEKLQISHHIFHDYCNNKGGINISHTLILGIVSQKKKKKNTWHYHILSHQFLTQKKKKNYN